MKSREVKMREKILRMIDANANRATEGLRVAEDVVRFVLDDSKLTSKLKDVRHRIVAIVKRLSGPKPVSLFVRNVHSDVGAERTTRSEAKRTNVLDVFMANIKRAEESVRVFEETSKLFDPKLGPKFKKLRFELYDIEQKAALKLKKKIKLEFNLCVITDPSFGRSHLEIMKQAAAGGAEIVQLRDKNMSRSEYLKTAKAMSKWAKSHNITFIVNDHADIAKKVNADGVHLGFRDATEHEMRHAGKDMIIGISASNLKEALKAQALGADYIGFGPVFSTPIKSGVKPAGINALSEVMKKVTIPVVAIGGIDKRNIKQVLSAGCNRVAVIRAISGARDIAKSAKQLIGILNDKCQMTKLK
ncbi:MAG: thiamine phosphate synthase [bacterium]